LPAYAESAFLEVGGQDAGDIEALVVPQRVGGGDADVFLLAAVADNAEQLVHGLIRGDVRQRLGGLQTHLRFAIVQRLDEQVHRRLVPRAVEGADGGGADERALVVAGDLGVAGG